MARVPKHTASEPAGLTGPTPNFGPGAAESMFPVVGADYLYEAVGATGPSSFQDDDGFLPLTAPEVLCNKCVHGFIVKSRAPVQNKKPDGSSYKFVYGQCLYVSPPMSLDDLRVEECSMYTPSAEPEKKNV